jgi:hypothetical protein
MATILPLYVIKKEIDSSWLECHHIPVFSMEKAKGGRDEFLSKFRAKQMFPKDGFNHQFTPGSTFEPN